MNAPTVRRTHKRKMVKEVHERPASSQRPMTEPSVRPTVMDM